MADGQRKKNTTTGGIEKKKKKRWEKPVRIYMEKSRTKLVRSSQPYRAA